MRKDGSRAGLRVSERRFPMEFRFYCQIAARPHPLTRIVLTRASTELCPKPAPAAASQFILYNESAQNYPRGKECQILRMCSRSFEQNAAKRR